MKKILVVIIASTFALLSGCASLQTQPAWAARVNVDGDSIQFTDVRSWTDPQNGLMVSAKLESSARINVAFQYRMLWYTGSGQPISTILNNWTQRTARPHQIIEISAFSPGPRAQDFRIEVIEK